MIYRLLYFNSNSDIKMFTFLVVMIISIMLMMSMERIIDIKMFTFLVVMIISIMLMMSMERIILTTITGSLKPFFRKPQPSMSQGTELHERLSCFKNQTINLSIFRNDGILNNSTHLPGGTAATGFSENTERNIYRKFDKLRLHIQCRPLLPALNALVALVIIHDCTSDCHPFSCAWMRPQVPDLTTEHSFDAPATWVVDVLGSFFLICYPWIFVQLDTGRHPVQDLNVCTVLATVAV